MNLKVSKEELMSLRHVVSIQLGHMRHCPNPSAYGDCIPVAEKFIRKLNAALKKTHGHDCMGDTYLNV